MAPSRKSLPHQKGEDNKTTISRYWWACVGFCCLLVGCARDPVSDRIARLSDPDAAVRRTAARSLRGQPRPDERVIAALTKSAADTDAEVRYVSIDALGQYGANAKSSLPVLKSALADSEKRVRLEAALAIPKIDRNDASFPPILISAMREGDGRTLLAVGAMGADAAWAVPTLIGLLSHPTPQVRALAARTLGRIGPAASTAKSALETARGDSNAAVQNAAKDALNRIEAKPTAGGGK